MTTIGEVEAREAKMDSKVGTWQHAGGMLQPPWLSRRKASPWPTTSTKEDEDLGV